VSAADQRKVVAALRGVPPEGWDRWTQVAVARAAGIGKPETDAAVRALRYAGKIKFGALELSASMLEEYRAKAGDEAGEGRTCESPVEPVSRGADARSSAATSELMDATAGETAPVSGLAAQAVTERLDDLGSVQDGLHKCPRTGRAGVPLVRATVTDADTVVTAGETAPNHEPATEPCVHPGCEQGDVAAAGVGRPPPEQPRPTHPAVRDTADEAGAPAVRASSAPAPSIPAQPGNPLGVALLDEIEAYLARTRMGGSLLGELAVGHPGYVNLLRKRRTARAQTADPMRAFMRRWPEGATRDAVMASRHAETADNAAALRAASIAAAHGVRFVDARAPGPGESLADEIKAEALAIGARRRQAKCTGTVKAPLSANVVAIQAALLSEPEDAFVFLRRKWPELLRQVIALAKVEEITPATMLVRVIEAGILSIADNLREEAA